MYVWNSTRTKKYVSNLHLKVEILALFCTVADFFGDRAPDPYLRVWMTPPPPPSPYLKVWICHCCMSLKRLKRIFLKSLHIIFIMYK